MPDFLTGRGRIGRLHYFGISIAVGICGVACSTILGSQKPGSEIPVGALLLTIPLGVIAIWIGTAAGVRRLHDLNCSGWQLLLTYIPIVGFFIGLKMTFSAGTPGANKYGKELSPRFDASRQHAELNEQKLAELRNGTSEGGHDYLNSDGTFNSDGIFDYTK